MLQALLTRWHHSIDEPGLVVVTELILSKLASTAYPLRDANLTLDENLIFTVAQQVRKLEVNLNS